MTEYEKNFQIVKKALETYRDTPPDDEKRRFVDWLMKKSLKDAQDDTIGKKYHNLIVLRYISSMKRAKKPICDALHIGRSCYDDVTGNAIDRLLVLAFGVNGIDWAGPQVEAEAPPKNTLTGRIMELTRLKYSLVAELLAGMERHIRDSAELPERERGGILDTIETEQARLVLNAAFDL